MSRHRPQEWWTSDRRGLLLRGMALAALGLSPVLTEARRARAPDAPGAPAPFVPDPHRSDLYRSDLHGPDSRRPGAGDPSFPDLATQEPAERETPGGKPQGHWVRPLSASFRVSAAYGIPGGWMAGRHTGIDLAVRSGTPVYSVGSGTVVLARPSGSYGNAVTVRIADGHYTLFAHLSEISVRVGKRVWAGTLLGSSGATGRVTGPHLHFEVRARRRYGSDVDPVRYLAGRGVQLL